MHAYHLLHSFKILQSTGCSGKKQNHKEETPAHPTLIKLSRRLDLLIFLCLCASQGKQYLDDMNEEEYAGGPIVICTAPPAPDTVEVRME